MANPDPKTLARARDDFRDLLSRQTTEPEWQKFFADNPYVLSMSLPLRLNPGDLVPMARPGKTEPDFVFYPQRIRPLPFYGVIELKRPDTKIVTITRRNVALFTRDAQTAIEQASSFAKNPGGLVPIERPEKMLFLGNTAHIFVIMGMSQELTQKLGIQLYNEMICAKLPGNLQILPYDTLLKNFETILPRRILFLVPALDTFEFETVTIDAYGNVRESATREGHQLVETLGSGVTLDLVEIPGGTFLMGSPRHEQFSTDDERPQHEVTVSPFHIGKFTVTQAQWRVVTGLPPIDRKLETDPSQFKGDDRPVEQVSWEDAVEFCARLSRKTGKLHRLPTEAEWEYACRAGNKKPFAFGDSITPQIVNYDGNHPYGKAPKGDYREGTIAVGSLGVANEYGLYDMHGNVWEWCHDWHGPYPSGAANDPVGPSKGKYRRLRGGSWIGNANNCRSACRFYNQPCNRNHNFGFRVVVVSRIH
ncbi:MAG TPA: SUMF1/EgtB/PvdO family nonheme iron enzyme [Blastocatellia bacterium]|nr:SUMF1/EgtB/PvdO family nonheme iron enzyme [Blastocatellia bacterium]